MPQVYQLEPQTLTWLHKAEILGFCFLIIITNDMFLKVTNLNYKDILIFFSISRLLQELNLTQFCKEAICLLLISHILYCNINFGFS